MQQFIITYTDKIFSGDYKYVHINAMCSEDARNYFLDNYNGFYLRCEFVDWL